MVVSRGNGRSGSGQRDGAVTAVATAGVEPTAPPRSPRSPRPTVVAVYYPHWHTYDHGSAWKGEGWTEWEGLKAAVPRFPGHQQPKEPSWGYFDESDPRWAEREIAIAVSHGVDVFMYDWYWYSGVRNMEEALERGFLGATNRNDMAFCLMWANHDRKDQFCPEFGRPRNVWLPSRHSPADLNRVIDYCSEHYFRQPNYWKVEDRAFFSVYQATRFVWELGGPQATRALLDAIDKRLCRDGLAAMHWNGMTNVPAEAAMLKEAGFRSTSTYTVNDAGCVRADGTESYADLMGAHRRVWDGMSSAGLPYMPVVAMGWDPTPRCRADVPWPFPAREYPYVPVVVGNTPERFAELLRNAGHLVGQGSQPPQAVLIYCWNEWTEGGYLLPEKRTGTAYLEAVKGVFGTRR